MGETRVDLLHLLEDLRDAYPGSLEETVLTEVMANSLDSGASRIAIATDPVQSALSAVDNGTGMKRRELARYHDVAASRKERGAGIGFAGVGIKLGLLCSEQVVTETRRGKTHAATRWSLASRHRAPWKWIPPPGLVGESGTAVSLKLTNPLSPLLDQAFLEETLRGHFEPLLDPEFAGILEGQYPQGIAVVVNARRLAPERPDQERAQVELHVGRRRKPSAAGYIARSRGNAPLPPHRRGVAVSTLGKVIKRGWEWLGLSPAKPDFVGGLIEAPALAACLTLTKSDFIRVGQKGAVYLAYRKAIQEAVSAQLAAWGESPEEEPRSRRRTDPFERDIEAVLMSLADEFPLLDALVEKHAGGQRKLRPAPDLEAQLALEPDLSAGGRAEEEKSTVSSAEEVSGGPLEPRPRQAPGRYGNLPSDSSGPRRRARFALKIQFERREDSAELGRLADSTLWINEAHPAYARSAASKSESYHVALAAALSLAQVAAEPGAERAFLTSFLKRWGEEPGTLAGSRLRRR